MSLSSNYRHDWLFSNIAIIGYSIGLKKKNQKKIMEGTDNVRLVQVIGTETELAFSKHFVEQAEFGGRGRKVRLGVLSK